MCIRDSVWVNQVHGIEVIDAAQSACLQNADASFTTKPNVVCVTMTADCLPVLLCDKAGTVVAAVHAGWRGLCDGVIEAAVNKLPEMCIRDRPSRGYAARYGDRESVTPL